MARLLALCAASLAFYVCAFTFVLDRPLSLGVLAYEMAQKTARLAALPSPKLVILAGSNGPYSHSCAVIGPMLNLPCENAGIAVGIGLDDLFARYAPFLRPGDIVYMPMELQQYATTRRQNDEAADGAILLRHDRGLLALLPADRLAGAAFSSNFPSLLEGFAEMLITRVTRISAPAAYDSDYDLEGDRIGTSLATANQTLLQNAAPSEPDEAAISTGYGAALIRHFVARQTGKGVTVIGGLPTHFQDIALPARTLAVIGNIYTANGARFVALPNFSAYPRVDFYDSPDHLALPCQYLHSIAVAALLAGTLNLTVRPPLPAVAQMAASCPSAASGWVSLR